MSYGTGLLSAGEDITSGNGTEPGAYPVPQDDDGAWIVAVARKVWGWIQGLVNYSPYPFPLPAPLVYSSSDVAAMLTRYPAVASELRDLIARQGHRPCEYPVDPRSSANCGHAGPAPAEWYATPLDLARLGMWYANGTGDDLSRNEDEMRTLIVQAMLAYTRGETTAPGDTDPDVIDILVSTAASQGREAAEKLARDLARGVYAVIPDSWREAIERGVRDYYGSQLGGVLQGAGPVALLVIGGGLLLALARARGAS